MKKTLSIFLTLVLLVSMVISVPLLTSVAGDDPTISFAEGSWKITTNAGGTATPNATEKTVSFTGAQSQTMYTKLTGLTLNTTYELTFDISPTLNAQVWLLSGEETVSFTIDGTVPAKATYHSAINGTKATIEFAAAETSYYIFFRNALTTGATAAFTFSNFDFKAASTLTDEQVAGNAIANGEWKITTNAGGTVTKSNGTVKFTGAQSQTMYTKITGLTAGKKYELGFDVSPTMNAQVWLLSGDATVSFIIDGTVPNNASSLAAINGTEATVEFTAEETSYYIFFRNALNTGSTTEFTFSNFRFKEVSSLSDEEQAGNSIANGEWKITTNAGGTVTKSNGTVKFTGAQSQTMYTKITGLTADKAYKLTFDVSPTMNAQVWLLSGDATVSFIIDGTVPNNASSLAAINGTKATVEFTSTETSYYIFFRNALNTGSTTEFTFSNFAFGEVASDSNTSIADGEWKITTNAGGTVSHNTTAHTVSFTGAQYQAIYTKISGLTANTKYALTFDSTSPDLAFAYLINGSDEAVTFSDSLPTNASRTSLDITYDVNKVKIKFTATEESHWLVIRNNGATQNITLSNFELAIDSATDDTDMNPADIDWYITKNAGGTVSHNSTAHTVSFTGAQYQAIYTKFTNLTPNTEYELVFDSTIDTLTLAYLINGSDEAVTFNDTLPTNSSRTNLVISFSENTATIKFVATEESHWLVIRNTNSPESFTLSNMSLNKNEVGVSTGNDAGYAISDGTWKAFNPHQSSNVVVDTVGHTVSTDNTDSSIYTKFTVEANSHYKLTFNYVSTGTAENAILDAKIVTSKGQAPTYNKETSALDNIKNGICSSYQNDINNKSVLVEFVTGEGTEYYLSVQTGKFDTLTLSGFNLEKVSTMSAKEAGGAQVVIGEWAAKCSNIAVSTKDVTTRTIKASNTNYHWVIGKITGLTVGQTYKLSFKDKDGSSQSVFALPADEDATSDKDYVIDGNGSYTGRYYDCRGDYSATVKNSETGVVSIVFTAALESYHIFIHHQAATSAVYSDFTFEKFTEIKSEQPTVSTSPKGLRFAFTISKDLLDGFNGLKVKEFGTISAQAKDLRSNELVLNSYQAAGMSTIKKQVAYSKADNINDIYSESASGDKTFTAIITGIPASKKNTQFAVRPYIILENNTVIYGATQTSSLAEAE